MAKDVLNNIDPVENQKTEIQKYMSKLKANKIVLGADLVEVRENIGKEIVDKENGGFKTDENGEPLRWPSKYHAKFIFMGGEVESEINQVQYQSLVNNIGLSYYLEGRLSKVKNFGSEVIAPVFTSFELLV